MSNPKPVYVVAVQSEADGAIVTISGKGGQQEQWFFGKSQMRMIALSFAAVFRDISAADLAKEIAGLCEAEEAPVA